MTVRARRIGTGVRLHPAVPLRRFRRKGPPPAGRRWGWALFVALLAVVASGAALLARGITLDSEALARRIADDLGEGAQVSLGRATLAVSFRGVRLALEDVMLRRAEGAVAIETARVMLAPVALVTGRAEPRVVRLSGVAIATQAAAKAEGEPGLGALAQSAAGALLAFEAVAGGRFPAVEIERLQWRRGAERVPLPLLSDLSFAVEREAGGAVQAIIARGSAEGRKVLARGRLDGAAAAERRLHLASDTLTLGDLAPWIGGGVRQYDPAGPVGLSGSVVLLPDGAMRDMAVDVRASASQIMLTDKDIPPFALRMLHLAIRRADPSSPVQIERLAFALDDSAVTFTGALAPDSGGSTAWTGEISATTASLEGLNAGEAALVPEGVMMHVSLDPTAGQVEFGPILVKAGGGEAKARLRYHFAGTPRLSVELAAHDLDIRAALRLWPVNVAPPVRAWLVPRLTRGRLEKLSMALDLAGDDLAAAFENRPLPQEALALDFALAEAEIFPLGAGLPVHVGRATGRATGRGVTIDIANGAVQAPGAAPLALRGVSFQVRDVDRKPPVGQLVLPLSGRLEALLATLRLPALRAYAPVEALAGAPTGDFDVTTRISLPLVADPPVDDTQWKLSGSVRNVALADLPGEETMEAGQFQVSGDRQGFTLKGEARLSGLPAQIEVKPLGRKRHEVVVSLTLDDAARAKRGIPPGLVSGPVGLALTTALGGSDDQGVEIDADLTRASLSPGVPGLAKASGQAARLKASLVKAKGEMHVKDLRYESGAVQISGQVEARKGGEFRAASLSSFKLSPGDNARVEVERRGGAFVVNVQGNSVDARPFLRAFQKGRIDEPGGADFELSLRTTVLSGFNGELITDAALKVSQKGGLVQDFSLQGRMDGAVVTARGRPASGGKSTITAQSDNAGAALRFLDYYTRMQGGALALQMSAAKSGQDVLVQVRDFALRNEPALRQFASGGGDVAFTKLRAKFRRVPGKITIEEAVMWGPQVGGTIDGVLDYGKDRAALNGTLVPAYALNNAFAQIPLVGPLLGGNQYEGLFAVRFALSGTASDPKLSINPLTAVAPGFLRRLVDFGRANDGALPPAAGPRTGD